MFEQLGLIGCGLMGGSLALAAKRAGIVRRVVGFSKSAATTERALQLGVVDAAAATAAEAATGADLVVIATPVGASESIFGAIREHLATNALVIDVGSTKCAVIAAARHTLGDRVTQFVPCHPIVGREVAGVEYADAGLYTGGEVVITPLAETPHQRIEQAGALWKALGCKTLQTTPEAHDAALAAVSHLPHVLAFAFINAIAGQREGATYLSLAGSGFRDFSRIAASNPEMWRDIFVSNKKEINVQLGHFRKALDRIEQLINAEDTAALANCIGAASRIRTHWREGKSTKSVA